MKLTIGTNIRELRRKHHITQEQLADKLGVSYQSVSRWENDTCYPDMELLPALSRIFSVSIDHLLGVSEEDKNDKVIELLKLFSKAANEPWDRETLISVIVALRRDYPECLSIVQMFELSVQKGLYRDPAVLAELRLTADELIMHTPDVWIHDQIVLYMARMEDDAHIEDFLRKYASVTDLSRDVLLQNRYQTRMEYDKLEQVRQSNLYTGLDRLFDSSLQGWQDIGKPADVHRLLYVNDVMLDLLHHVCNCDPSPAFPISGNGEVDFWVEQRLWMGMRRACYMVALNRIEEAYLILEDTVSLLEKAMTQANKTELRCGSPSLDQMVWISEECWLACDEGDLIQWTQSGDSSEDIQEKARYIHREGNCYMIFPSWFYRALTERQGWEWFDPIRETPRFQAYAARISRLIVQRKRTF
ncbi:MAG: helix-turn-helix transcriptional regulator [Clostridia bacterium]|nr:helix-turn-helix transcriptional regulator [Clostridia bacterium]